jgi:hypothetical protein
MKRAMPGCPCASLINAINSVSLRLGMPYVLGKCRAAGSVAAPVGSPLAHADRHLWLEQAGLQLHALAPQLCHAGSHHAL